MSFTDITYSIILPVYNGEKTIERAIKSVLTQNLNGWELIIIENGSTDRTVDIVKKFLFDKRIHLIHSEKGVSKARNEGLAYAKGEWILFLDADDEFNAHMFEILQNYILLNNDLIVCNYSYFKENKSFLKIDTNEKMIDYICKCLNNPTKDCTLHNILFNKELIIKNGIKFDVDLTHAEDSLFFLETLVFAKEILLLPNDFYIYSYSMNSAVRKFDNNQFKKYIPTIFKIKALLKNFDIKVQNEINSFILNQVLIVLVNNIFANKTLSFDEKIQYEKNILSNEIVNQAIENETFLYCDSTRKIIFKLMENRNYKLIGFFCTLKANINRRKGD